MVSQFAARSLTLLAFARTLMRAQRLRNRPTVAAFQSRKLAAFLRDVVPGVRAYADVPVSPLSAYPPTDKAQIMAHFAAYNRLGLSRDDAWRHFENGGAPQGYAVGASTGTSGNRGLYLVSDTERFTWLGVMLAKALPDMLTQRYRVAIMLPANSRLYDAANESRRLALQFFDLKQGIEPHFGPLQAFRPNVILAPPKVLRVMVEAGLQFDLKHVFSAAEVLDPVDRDLIEAGFGRRIREIYMATEGLFAVSCAQGHLHLAEDCVAFEWEADPETPHLVRPMVTDFTRRTQIMLRYRMNDLLELDPAPCPCGLGYQRVKAVHGRADDMLLFHLPDGTRRHVSPDIIRNAIIGADRSLTDFRVVQTGPDRLEILVPPAAAASLAPIADRVGAMFRPMGLVIDVSVQIGAMTIAGDTKLRRVRRLWTPEV